MKIKKHCDQCNALVINGIFCHEHGCPNERKTWNDGEWIRFVECYDCGEEIQEGAICTCNNFFNEEE